jgi:hypothetical protein
MITDVLANIRNRLIQNEIVRMDEDNVGMSLILPVIKAIGWDPFNNEEVLSRYMVPGLFNDVSVNYALICNTKLLALIKARPLYSDLSKTTYFGKIFITAKKSDAKYLIICNGVDWHIYQANQNKEAIKINLWDSEAANKLMLLSKSNIENGLLEEYYLKNSSDIRTNNTKRTSRGYKVTDETHATLTSLRVRINSSRINRDGGITNSMIIERLLNILFSCSENFDWNDIHNERFLENKLRQCLGKGLN